MIALFICFGTIQWEKEKQGRNHAEVLKHSGQTDKVIFRADVQFSERERERKKSQKLYLLKHDRQKDGKNNV